jgi:hypothetical protein
MSINTSSNPIYIDSETARAREEYLVNVGKEIAESKEYPTIEEIDGHTYVFYRGRCERVKTVEPDEEKQPAVFKAFSLQGLVDFIKVDVDGLFKNPERRHIVRVTDVDKVEVLTPVTGFYKKRYIVAECNALVPPIPFNTFKDTEDFQIMVQTRFEDTENRALVLKLSGSLRNEQTMQTADDGVLLNGNNLSGLLCCCNNQLLIQRFDRVDVDDLCLDTDVTVKNPVTLIPLRTFYEVKQPSSPFVLRFNEDSEAALFEGDGGAWKLSAVKNIKDWLEKELVGTNVEIIA